jgi:hypothetical protein
MNIKDVGFEDVSCNHIAQDRVQSRAFSSKVLKFSVP